MTRDTIVTAAFQVWGREFYKTTSLAKLADNLGVSKPALYRHFPGKHALLLAMENRFYDDYAAALKPDIEQALAVEHWQKRILMITRTITGYFARHFEYFIFFLNKMNNKDYLRRQLEQMGKRGVCLPKLAEGCLPVDRDFPSIFLLTGFTALFGTGFYHKRQRRIGKGQAAEGPAVLEGMSPSRFADYMAERVRKGLGFDKNLVKTLPFDALEKLDPAPPPPRIPCLRRWPRLWRKRVPGTPPWKWWQGFRSFPKAASIPILKAGGTCFQSSLWPKLNVSQGL
jgi:AcrR family transcriptional regulator